MNVMCKSNLFSVIYKISPLLLALLTFAIIIAMPPLWGISQTGWSVLAVMAFMIMLWISETIPLCITALIPLILFPILNIDTFKSVAAGYAHPVVFMLFGSLIIAKAIEKSGLHSRIAFYFISITGKSPSGLIFGIMLSTTFLSMWMPNTGAVALMLPICLSIYNIIAQHNVDPTFLQRYLKASVLCVLYGGNIGGVATLIGTPTNAIFVGFAQDQLDTTISFAQWMAIGVPVSLSLLLLGWFILTQLVFQLRPTASTDTCHKTSVNTFDQVQLNIQKKLSDLGPLSYQEKAILAIFTFTLCLWLGKDLLPVTFTDANIAVLGGILCFCTPNISFKNNVTNGNQNSNSFLLSQHDLTTLPLYILFFFGGGLALANAVQTHGLGDVLLDLLLPAQGSEQNIVMQITEIQNIPLWVAFFCVVILLLTEIMGNIPVILIMLPILTAFTTQFEVYSVSILIIATFAASFAFMLPIATPPNLIVFASGHLKIKDMIWPGIWMNTAALLVLIITYICIKP